jgi:hypothetical protein
MPLGGFTGWQAPPAQRFRGPLSSPLRRRRRPPGWRRYSGLELEPHQTSLRAFKGPPKSALMDPRDYLEGASRTLPVAENGGGGRTHTPSLRRSPTCSGGRLRPRFRWLSKPRTPPNSWRHEWQRHVWVPDQVLVWPSGQRTVGMIPPKENPLRRAGTRPTRAGLESRATGPRPDLTDIHPQNS